MIEFDAVAFRRDIHANPELATEVARTASKVAEVLQTAGLSVTRNVGGHGVVATIGDGPDDTALLFRADMDALPIQEISNVPHQSTIPGRHHGCGHDGHTSMLLNAGVRMAANPPPRKIILMFQPDEENGTGATAMLDDGLLDQFPVSRAFAVHVMPGLSHGQFSTAAGPFCSFEENFTIRLAGQGGHASMPHRLADPLVAGASLVSDLQTVVSRSCNPSDHAVLSVTEFKTDGARNVVPSNVCISGDFRGFEDHVAMKIREGIERIAEGVAIAHGISAEVSISRSFSPLVNDSETVSFALASAEAANLTVSNDYPRCGFSEDFAAVSSHVPGAFLLMGQGTEGRYGRPLHDPQFEFDDRLIETGSRFWESLAYTV